MRHDFNPQYDMSKIQNNIGCGQTVAFLLPDLRGGGAEDVMLNFGEEFAKRGFVPHFILAQAQGAFLERAQRSKFSVTNLAAERFRDVASPLRRWFINNKPYACIPAMWPLTSIGIWAARGLDIPVVTTDHNTLSQQYANKGLLHHLAMRFSIRSTYPYAYANIAVSRGAAHDIEQLARLPKGTMSVVHNPIPNPNHRFGDSIDFNPAHELIPAAGPAKWRFKIDGRTTQKILAVGNFRRQKDFPTLLKSFRHLLDQGQNAELVILGEGAERATLEQLIRTLDLSEHVTLPGFTKDTNAYYRTADLFVLSSLYEGFANVIVEALAHGLRVVSTDCPNGPSEILSKSAYGTLVPVQDTKALAAAMNASLSAPHNPQAARARAAEFEPQIATDHFLKLMPPVVPHNARGPK